MPEIADVEGYEVGEKFFSGVTRRDVLRGIAGLPFAASALLSGQLEAAERSEEDGQAIIHMMLTQMSGAHTIKRPGGAVECMVGSTPVRIEVTSSGACRELVVGQTKVVLGAPVPLEQFAQLFQSSLSASSQIAGKSPVLHADGLARFYYSEGEKDFMVMPEHVYEMKGGMGNTRLLIRDDGAEVREEHSDPSVFLLTQDISSGGRIEDRWVQGRHHRTRTYGSNGAVLTSDVHGYYHSGERFSTKHHRFVDGVAQLVRQDTFFKNGDRNARYTVENDQLLAYGIDGSLVCRVDDFGDGTKRSAVILGENEEELLRVFQGDSIGEAAEYIRKMPEVFLRNGKWDRDRYNAFLQYFMLYQHEGVSDRLKFGSVCLLNQKDGCIAGDCDNSAFISRDMLRHGEENAHCLSIYIDHSETKRHMTCVVLKKIRGRWHAYSFCNFGISHNGVLHGMDETPGSLRGHDTAEDAICSLLPQFVTWEDILKRNWRVTLDDSSTYEVHGTDKSYYSAEQSFTTHTFTNRPTKLVKDSF